MNNKRNAKGVDIVGTNLKVPFHFYFDFFQRDEKSHKEVFMLICLLSKQIFSNLLKIRRSSFSKSACLYFTHSFFPLVCWH